MQTRIGVIGYGLSGNLAALFHQPGGRSIITAFCEINPDRTAAFKAQVTQDCYFTEDYRELIARDDVDAVLLLTEDYKHKEMALEILAAKKDLYLEKPMALSIEDCDLILAAWEKSGRKMMIGFNMRYMPMYQTMKAYIYQGAIGEVKAIWVRHFVGFGGKFYFQDWHRNQQGTHSLLLQKASHDIDVIHMLGGAYVSKVSAFGSLDFYDDPQHFEADGLTNQTEWDMNVEDNNVMIMDLANGIKAAYLQCHFTPDYSRNYVVIGTKGRMENDDVNQTITIKHRHTQALEDQSDLVIHMKKQEGGHDGGDQAIVKGFLDYLQKDIAPKASPLDGRMSVAVGVQATKSLRTGGTLQSVTLPGEA